MCKRREEHQCVCIFLPLRRLFNERQNSCMALGYYGFSVSLLKPLDVDHSPVLVDTIQTAK